MINISCIESLEGYEFIYHSKDKKWREFNENNYEKHQTLMGGLVIDERIKY